MTCTDDPATNCIGGCSRHALGVLILVRLMAESGKKDFMMLSARVCGKVSVVGHQRFLLYIYSSYLILESILGKRADAFLDGTIGSREPGNVPSKGHKKRAKSRH